MPYKHLLHKITSSIYDNTGSENTETQTESKQTATAVLPSPGPVNVIPGNGNGAMPAYTTPANGGQTTKLEGYQGSSSDFYNTLVEETDPDKVAIFNQLNQSLKKLEGVVANEKERFRAALATSGLTAEQLAAGYDELLQTLDTQQQLFAQQLKEHVACEVTDKEMECANLDEQIASKQKEAQQLKDRKDTMRTDAIVAKAKLETASSSFSDSFNRRKAELLNKKAEVVRMLQ